MLRLYIYIVRVKKKLKLHEIFTVGISKAHRR